MQIFFSFLLNRSDSGVLVCSQLNSASIRRKIFDGKSLGMAEVTMDGKQCLVLAWE